MCEELISVVGGAGEATQRRGYFCKDSEAILADFYFFNSTAHSTPRLSGVKVSKILNLYIRVEKYIYGVQLLDTCAF